MTEISASKIQMKSNINPIHLLLSLECVYCWRGIINVWYVLFPFILGKPLNRKRNMCVDVHWILFRICSSVCRIKMKFRYFPWSNTSFTIWFYIHSIWNGIVVRIQLNSNIFVILSGKAKSSNFWFVTPNPSSFFDWRYQESIKKKNEWDFLNEITSNTIEMMMRQINIFICFFFDSEDICKGIYTHTHAHTQICIKSWCDHLFLCRHIWYRYEYCTSLASFCRNIFGWYLVMKKIHRPSNVDDKSKCLADES